MNRNINKSQPQELLHYFLFDPNIYISAVMKLKRKSDVTIEAVKQAVEKAYTQNETTMSKVVLNNGEAYFENMSETGCKVFIDQRNWKGILNENEKIHLKSTKVSLSEHLLLIAKMKSQYLLWHITL